MLAELYIDNLFLIQPKEMKDDIYMPHLINPTRHKLVKFLEEKKNYDPSVLLAKVKDSWMIEEEIILLVKEKQYEPAIKIFIDNGQYVEAEKFCDHHSSLGLMTTLLKIYFDKFREHWDRRNRLLQEKKSTESIQEKEIAGQFKKQALDLMKRYSSGNQLDPHLVLELIPEDWDI